MNGKQLRNSILQWAIQGKLVPQDPNDEPASVLLERIRAEKKRLVKEGKIKKDKNESIIYKGDDNSYYEKFSDGKIVCIDEEIPFEIPQGWEWCRISNIFLHTSGKQQSSSNKKTGTLRQYITTSNLYWNRFVLDSLKEMYFSDDEIKTCSATKGDLLVCEGGAGYGRSAIWNFDYDICLQNHIHRLRPIVDGICEYVYYFIYLLKESNHLASVGTAMPGLSANRLNSLLLPLPPKNEQSRIVGELKTLEPLINRYSKLQNDLDLLSVSIKDLLCKSILQEAIQGKLVSHNPDDESVTKLLERIYTEKQKLVKEGKLKAKDSIIYKIFKGADNKYYEQIGANIADITEEIPFEIPDSWIWCRFGNIVKMHIGKTPPRGESKYWADGTYPWVAISDMNNSGHIKNTKEKISLAAATSLMGNNISHIGDLLMSFKLTVGKTAILDIDAFHNEAIITIAQYYDYNNIVRDYLFNILPIVSNLGDSKDAIKGKTLNSQSLFNILIPLPPIQEQQRIVHKIDEIQMLIQ